MSETIADNMTQRYEALRRTFTFELRGRIVGMTGLTVEVVDFAAPVGALCDIITRHDHQIPAEVIGFRGEISVLMPLAEMTGIACGDHVTCKSVQRSVPVGSQLLGRVINAQGQPIDGKGPLLCQTRSAISAEPLEPLSRVRINTPLGTGIRAIDALMTCGCGQRMGIFSGPGVGKSVLLGMISRYTSADVSVIALIGERGREVREFLEKDLGPRGLERSVVVVSTSDEPAPLRVQAGFVATSIAEHFREQGANVLLLMDSVTRIAMAQRQIGLAMGEPPATRGFTPSVFALLPRLFERCGRSVRGSITGFFTVLVEGDDMSEPIADAVQSILDGHLWLSRDLANRGHYPALDMLHSISRVMSDITGDEHKKFARQVIKLIATYKDIEDLVNIGAYAPGANAEFDLAVQAQPAINQFLSQGMDEYVSIDQTLEQLKQLNDAIAHAGNAISRQAPASLADKQKKPQNKKPAIGMERMMAGI